jgi:choline kinase
MIDMKAIIFAAGRSRRLGSLTDNLPKSCLNLHKDESILDNSLSNILSAGFKDLVLVVGHAKEKIIALVKSKWQNKFSNISFVDNPDYLNKNNIFSAYLIREQLENDTFIFNSDIVYDGNILQKAVDYYKSNSKTLPKSFLVVDDHKDLVDEDMKVLVQESGADNKILRIHKNLDNQEAFGEYIGIMHIAGQDIKLFRTALEELIAAKDFDKYYEDALDKVASKLNLTTVSTAALAWTEVDTLEDYERAKELIKFG